MLISKVRIDNLLQPIQYEGITTICFDCGRVGHKASLCPSVIHPLLRPPIITSTFPFHPRKTSPQRSSVNG
ncbi:hypothetical protein CFP56_019832 [Quercus suber]|uniref:CCHC-type domain-containing protein n=1 Tax=Quercus suber TaxID=58331 RepID=A0AAW0LZS7_QUESU